MKPITNYTLILIIVFLNSSCNQKKQENDIRSYTGKAFQIYLPYLDSVGHEEWIQIDTTLFVHDRNIMTTYIDGAEPKEKKDLYLNRNYTPLKTSSYIVYQAPERNWKENASNNQLIMELAMELASLSINDEKLYQIKGGSTLLYEGKLEFSRKDSSLIELKLSKDHPFVVKKLK